MKHHTASALFSSVGVNGLFLTLYMEPPASLAPYPLELEGMREKKEGGSRFSGDCLAAVFLQPSLGGFNPWLLLSMMPTGETRQMIHEEVLRSLEPQSEAAPWKILWYVGSPLRLLLHWNTTRLLMRGEVSLRADCREALSSAYTVDAARTGATARPLDFSPHRVPASVREAPRFGGVVQCWIPL